MARLKKDRKPGDRLSRGWLTFGQTQEVTGGRDNATRIGRIKRLKQTCENKPIAEIGKTQRQLLKFTKQDQLLKLNGSIA